MAFENVGQEGGFDVPSPHRHKTKLRSFTHWQAQRRGGGRSIGTDVLSTSWIQSPSSTSWNSNTMHKWTVSGSPPLPMRSELANNYIVCRRFSRLTQMGADSSHEGRASKSWRFERGHNTWMRYKINSECFFDVSLLQVLELDLFEEEADLGTMAKKVGWRCEGLW